MPSTESSSSDGEVVSCSGSSGNAGVTHSNDDTPAGPIDTEVSGAGGSNDAGGEQNRHDEKIKEVEKAQSDEEKEEGADR